MAKTLLGHLLHLQHLLQLLDFLTFPHPELELDLYFHLQEFSEIT